MLWYQGCTVTQTSDLSLVCFVALSVTRTIQHRNVDGLVKEVRNYSEGSAVGLLRAFCGQLTLLLGGGDDRTAERSSENRYCESGAVRYNSGSRRDRASVAVSTACMCSSTEPFVANAIGHHLLCPTTNKQPLFELPTYARSPHVPTTGSATIDDRVPEVTFVSFTLSTCKTMTRH